MHSYRDALVKSIVAKLLSDKTFQCLIRPPEDPLDTVEREDEFYDTYQSAAYFSTHTCAQHESVKVHNLSGVMPRFDRQSRTAVADYLHFFKDGSTRLDGHPVLDITQSAVFAYGGLLDEEKMSIVFTAKVIVEDKCDSENTGQAEESEKEAAPKLCE